MQDRLVAVNVLYETLYPSRKREILFLAGSLIREMYFHAVVKERKLPQPAREDVVVELDVAEHFRRRQKVDFGPPTLRFPNDLERFDRYPHPELDVVHLTIAANS